VTLHCVHDLQNQKVHSLDDIHMQVKCLRVLQYSPVPDDPVVSKGLENVLKCIHYR